MLKKVDWEKIEEIDRVNSTNQLVENTMRLTANVTEQSENVTCLLQARCPLINDITVLLKKILDAIGESDIDIDEDLMGLSCSNLKMIKVVSLVLRNICLHTHDISSKEHSKSSISGRKKKKPIVTS